MSWVVVILIGFAGYLIFSQLNEIIERLKVIEYEQQRQFKELTDKLELMDSEIKDRFHSTE